MGYKLNVFTGNLDVVTAATAASDSFTTIQTDSGTFPVADSSTDTLILVGDGYLTTVGNSTTDTVTITLPNPATSAISSTVIDWSILNKKGGLYTKTLSANTTFTFTNMVAGQTIVVKISNTVSDYTVTWPTAKWPNDVQPPQTIGARFDMWTFMYDGTNIIGGVVQNYYT